MAELTNEQLNDILENYNVLVETNEKANAIKLKLADGKGDYSDTLKYAVEVGDALAETLKFAITDELLEDGILPKSIAKRLLYKLLKANFNNISKECVKAQTVLNKKSKIGLKPIPPTYNQDKTDGLITYITEKEYKKREKSFLASVKQNSLSIVDDSVKANADFQYKSGMNPKIVRITDGKCCEWCSKLAGTYDYYKVMDTGNNVFRRHANCKCVVNYIPYKGKAVNVWTKKEVKKGYLDLLDTTIKKDYNDVEKYVFTSKVAEALKVNGVEYNAVKKHKRALSTDEIVERLGGGDMTKGSCASLSFAYVGNKAGLDVLDFRGGNSQLIFSRNVNIREIAKLDGVNSTFEKGYNDVKNASNLLKRMEKDKEFILITGRHASVVKHTNDGYLYLELQSNNDNGWHKLDTTVLRKRFGCTKSHTIARIKLEQTSYLIDVETLGENKEFQKLLGYINTNVDKQMKGDKGHVK